MRSLLLLPVLSVVVVALAAGCAGSGSMPLRASSVASLGVSPAFGGLTVFGDRLASGWLDASWNSTTQLDLGAPVYAGSRALSLTVTKARGALYLRASGGVDVSSYTELRFAARCPQAAGEPPQFAAWLTDANGVKLSAPRSLAAYGADMRSDAWTFYRLPLADLNADGRQIGGIVIQGDSDAPQATIYLDEIGFSATSVATPASPETPPSPSPSDATSQPSSLPTPATATPMIATPMPTPAQAPTVTPVPATSPMPTATPSPEPTAAPSPVAAASGSPAAGAPSPTPAPAEQTAAPRTIYSGALAPGWTTVATDASARSSTVSDAASDGQALAIRFTAPFGRVIFRSSTAFSAQGYRSLLFAARASAPGQQVTLQLADTNGAPVEVAVSLGDFGGQPVTSDWTLYQIPLSAFGVGSGPLAGIIVQDATGAPQPALYVDAIVLR
jgi:hypothetical protein